MVLQFHIPKLGTVTKEEMNEWMRNKLENGIIRSLYEKPEDFQRKRQEVAGDLEYLHAQASNLSPRSSEDIQWLSNIKNLIERLSDSSPAPEQEKFLYSLTIARAIDKVRYGVDIHDPNNSKVNIREADSSVNFVLSLQYK
jgi:hypothetical protein